MHYPVLVTFLVAVATLQAQQRPLSGTSGSTTPTSGSRSGLDPSTGLAIPGQPAGPVSLMGKVQIEGGGALEEPVRIERVCSGVAHAEGFTDSRGDFSVTLGHEQAAMPDASETVSRATLNPSAQSRGLTAQQLTTCDLRASLPGYRSDIISLANRRYLDNPNVGTIFLHRLGNVDGMTISATTALAPKDARKAFEKALEAERKSKPDEAQKELEKAVDIYPRFAAAWFELGRLYEHRDHADKAREAYTQSLTTDSRYLRPYERLYAMAFKQGETQQVADITDRLLRLDPYDYPEAYYYNAVANLKLNHIDAAEKSAREAIKLDTAHRDAKSNYTLGYILAQKGNYAESAQYLRACLTMDPEGAHAAEIRKQLGEVERLAQSSASQH
jgi:tetratricopeptide (TPR) repeat protein